MVSVLKIVKANRLLEKAMDDVRIMHKEILEMFEDTWEALETKDARKAGEVIGREDKTDQLNRDIRKNVLEYLSGMPMGGNVPLSLILIDFSTFLERIADHISYIAEDGISAELGSDKLSKKLETEKDLVLQMLKDMETAFGDCDEALANGVVGMFDRVDRIHKEILADLYDSDLPPKKVGGVIVIAKNLSRIAKYSKDIVRTMLRPYQDIVA
ncbi:MAG: PhoU domain-containing protein [Candidatus Altiarchaeota archaeon]